MVLLDVDKAGLETVRADFAAYGDRLHTLACDVTAVESVTGAFREIGRRFGRLNGLVCSAGLLKIGTLNSMAVEEFDQLFAVNVRGLWLSAREAMPLLKAAGAEGELARVVFLASISGIRHKIDSGAYAATKAAVIALTKVMAVESAPYKVLVNAVAPATVDTPMVRPHLKSRRQHALSHVGRLPARPHCPARRRGGRDLVPHEQGRRLRQRHGHLRRCRHGRGLRAAGRAEVAREGVRPLASTVAVLFDTREARGLTPITPRRGSARRRGRAPWRPPPRGRAAGRGLQRREQLVRGRGDLLHGAIERGLVGLGRPVEAAKLAHELQRGGADLLLGRGRLEVEQRLDVAAHGSLVVYVCADGRIPWAARSSCGQIASRAGLPPFDPARGDTPRSPRLLVTKKRVVWRVSRSRRRRAPSARRGAGSCRRHASSMAPLAKRT